VHLSLLRSKVQAHPKLEIVRTVTLGVSHTTHRDVSLGVDAWKGPSAALIRDLCPCSMAKTPHDKKQSDLRMLPLPVVGAVYPVRRWRFPHILGATALLTVVAYGLLYSQALPTQVEKTVRAFRSLPNDFWQESSSRHTDVNPHAISSILATIDGLRHEFDRQERQGYTKWLVESFSAVRISFAFTRTPTYPSCGLSTSDKKRYAELRRGGRIFIAINLLQNEELMPTLAWELLALLQELGPERVFVSVYENASMDLTVMHLRLLCQVSRCAETQQGGI
jgi:hypothetical protein